MIELFTTSSCVVHEVNVTVDPDRCVKCGAVNRWVVPATIDYETGNEALTRYLVFTEAMADYPFDDKNAIEGIVDAVLGGNDE